MSICPNFLFPIFPCLRIYQFRSEISGIDLPHFSIELTEDMRAAAVYTSGTPGGDGGANILDVYEFRILDIAENPSLEFLNHELKEIPDTTKPSIISGHINFDNRVLTIKFDEYIDATPGIRVNISEIHLSNITGEQTLNIGDPTYGNSIVGERRCLHKYNHTRAPAH